MKKNKEIRISKITKISDLLNGLDMVFYSDAPNSTDVAYTRDSVIELLAKFGAEVRDKTIDWSSENAETRTSYQWDGFENWEFEVVDTDSILKGKISEELKID